MLYRIRDGAAEVYLVHPGGPFFRHKDRGAWTIPKGLPGEGEELQSAAVREFEEETGLFVKGPLIDLGSIKQAGGKVVHAWACAGDLPLDYTGPVSNTFKLEWPPHSGKFEDFPEVDQGDFFALDIAGEKINPAQRAFIDRLLDHLAE